MNRFMTQPKSFIDVHHLEYVCLLEKSLYKLKQSPRQWYKKFDSFVIKYGFVRSKYDSCFYSI